MDIHISYSSACMKYIYTHISTHVRNEYVSAPAQRVCDTDECQDSAAIQMQKVVGNIVITLFIRYYVADIHTEWRHKTWHCSLIGSRNVSVTHFSDAHQWFFSETYLDDKPKWQTSVTHFDDGPQWRISVTHLDDGRTSVTYHDDEPLVTHLDDGPQWRTSMTNLCDAPRWRSSVPDLSEVYWCKKKLFFLLRVFFC